MGQDGWGRYTRRRKWYRDAELVEATPSTDVTPVPTPKHNPIDDSASPLDDPNHLTKLSSNLSTTSTAASTTDPTMVDNSSALSDTDAASTKSKRSSWFKKKRRTKSTGAGSSVSNATIASSDVGTDISRRSDEDDVQSPLDRIARDDEWRLGDDIRQHLDI
ncbi:hypothetical protein N0V83_001728 [Neocucurbitaria cava]|uniref:Uncharacterized protein n=1 Tax=Neocucurbitaria cava TaxID=798079 RepID=A0A9W8YGK9_9PLEO|nr:hypothetical protein N0V83_001728 [Neocucurbitaria cava]